MIAALCAVIGLQLLFLAALVAGQEQQRTPLPQKEIDMRIHPGILIGVGIIAGTAAFAVVRHRARTRSATTGAPTREPQAWDAADIAAVDGLDQR